MAASRDLSEQKQADNINDGIKQPISEKVDEDAIEAGTSAGAAGGGLSVDDEGFLQSFSEKEADKIYRKVDWRLVPPLTTLYLIALLDRANIGNAKIEGMEVSLGMAGTDYNIAVSIFFIPYILFEIPSNHLLSKFKKPSTYIGLLVVLWGIVMTLTGVVNNFSSLCATRFLLGVFEAGFFPGANYLVAQWYPPHRMQIRVAIFYCASAMSGAFSGLLAYLIARMDGAGGYEGWRWIFIIEGIVSVVCGIAAFFILPDSPNLSGKWLNDDETKFLNLSHDKYRGKKVKHTRKQEVQTFWKVIGDWQLWLLAIAYMSNTAPNYALKFTMPQIITTMGFSSSNAQLLTIPPYTVGAISGLTASVFADKFTWRAPFILGAQAMLLVAYSILVVYAPKVSDNVAVCYFSIHLACAGLYPIPPGITTWTVNNLGARKRAMGIASMVMIGSLGGIIGSYIFLEHEAPQYPTGYGTSLSIAGLGAVLVIILEIMYKRINAKRDEMPEEEIRAKYTQEQLEDMDDRSPLFRYNL